MIRKIVGENFRDDSFKRPSRDGFELKFSLLCDPDHVQDMDTFPRMPWGMRECLFSDISRDSTVTSNGKAPSYSWICTTLGNEQ
jgi:hypothetical protein